MAKSAMRAASSQIGRQLVRGILGGILGGSTGRSPNRQARCLTAPQPRWLCYKKSPDKSAIRRFESFFVYCFGEAAGLAPSFFAPLPAFISTSVAVMV
jgi:hypothetical protein